MLSVVEIQNIINKKINGLKFNNKPNELYTPIQYVLNCNGKRIRPVLMIMSCNLFKNNINEAINPAIGLEIFHNFTLLHDDIMDNADLRRNQPTVHKKWNDNVAILSGDAMMIKSYDYFFDLIPKTFIPVIKEFNKAALQVCEGQQYDMNFENISNVSVNNYINMITLKTAVLLACSLKVGAIIGGAKKTDADLLYNFGINMGLAFQLQDDFLDVYGDVKTFGKKIGGDIISNKKTFLLIAALEKADKNTKSKLIGLLNNKKITNSEKIKNVTNIYNLLDIPEITKKKIEFYYKKSINIIDKVSVKNEKKNTLLELSNKLLNRNK